MQPFIGIIIYRSIIAMSGAWCIYLGYRLFSIVTEAQGRLSVSTGHDQALQLQDVAPGVFFALFGAVILIVSLFRPVVYDDGGHNGTNQTDGGNAEDGKGAGPMRRAYRIVGK